MCRALLSDPRGETPQALVPRRSIKRALRGMHLRYPKADSATLFHMMASIEPDVSRTPTEEVRHSTL